MHTGRFLDALTIDTDRDRVVAVVVIIAALAVALPVARILRTPLHRAVTRVLRVLRNVAAVIADRLRALVAAATRTAARIARSALRTGTTAVIAVHRAGAATAVRVRTTAHTVGVWHHGGGSRRLLIATRLGITRFLAGYSRGLFGLLLTASLLILIAPNAFPSIPLLRTAYTTAIIPRELATLVAIALSALAVLSALALPPSPPSRPERTPTVRRCIAYWSIGLGGAAGLAVWVALVLWGWPAVAVGVLTGATVALTGLVEEWNT